MVEGIIGAYKGKQVQLIGRESYDFYKYGEYDIETIWAVKDVDVSYCLMVLNGFVLGTMNELGEVIEYTRIKKYNRKYTKEIRHKEAMEQVEEIGKFLKENNKKAEKEKKEKKKVDKKEKKIKMESIEIKYENVVDDVLKKAVDENIYAGLMFETNW